VKDIARDEHFAFLVHSAAAVMIIIPRDDIFLDDGKGLPGA
jgi:hypothetical protein